ncbi:MAG: NUDIX hydrolase [Gammaproteobacteria bacterium]|nr:NUDIX hydrolase [Gammaproteobacteria bacterium]MBU1554318.1 NUDIX hydrolase [Gammaproteobacteria bacterium]
MTEQGFIQPLFTVDNVMFAINNARLYVLLVKRAIAPYHNNWSLPGGFVDIALDKDVEACAMRKLKQKTGLTPAYLEQLEVFSGADRDPRGYSVSLAFFALLPYTPVSSQINSVSQASWWPFDQLTQLTLAFDHQLIIAQAHQRLQQKALYSMLPVFCLPATFTVGLLKMVIETILGKEIQRKSLMRRIEASDMFTLTEQKQVSGGRQAQLYQLKPGVDITHFSRNMGA